MREISYDVDTYASDLAEALLDAGFDDDATIGDIARKGPNRSISLTVQVDDSDLVDHASADVLRDELGERGETIEAGARDLIDGIGYVRSGKTGLAIAMFGRVLAPTDLLQVERVLR